MLAVDSGFSNADIASLTVAMVALILAGLALIVGIQQWNLAQEQTNLTRKQAEIAEAQQKITREQHALLMQQVEQRGKMVLVFEPLTVQYATAVVFNVDVYLRNEGWFRVDDCTWSVFGSFMDITDTVAKRNMGQEIEGYHRSGWTGRYDGTVSRHEFKKVGTLRLRKNFLRGNPVQFWWFIDTPTQRFPEDQQFGSFTLTLDMIKPIYRWDEPSPPA